MTKHALLSGIMALTLLLLGNVASAQQGAASFDHAKTGFPLTGQHAFTECVSCHINARLAGTSRSCAVCHNGSLAPGKPTGHIPTNNTTACDTCHRNTVAWSGARMNHSGIVSGCTACHNGQAFYGVTPVSKSASHVVTTADCVTCHRSYVSFYSATGGAMPANHIPTAQTCTNCHAAGYSPTLTTMSHTGITSGCATCHNGAAFYGVTPVAKGANHFTTTQDCSICHSSTVIPGGFVTGTMNHTGITSGCATCHNGTAFQGVTPMAVTAVSNHVPTGSVACETCHTSTTVPGGFATFAMGAAGHTALGISTGSSCLTCHGTSAEIYFGVKAESDYSGHPATGSTNCASCHTSFTSFAGATGTAMPSNHIPVGSLPCSQCHANGYAVGLTVMSHTGITSGCATCHNGTAYYNVTPVSKGANHITTTQDCSVCHSSTVNPGGFVTGTMNHTGITSGCATCHGGQAFQNVTPMAETAVNHVPTGSVACETCHTSTTVPGGFANFTMGSAGHTALGISISSSCLTCHGTSAEIYFGVKAESDYSGHQATGSTNCASCHTSFTSFAGANGATAMPSNHIPVGSLPCSQCHANGYAVGLTVMSHTGITSSCATCHNGTAFYNVTPVSKGTNHFTTTQDCSICHSSTVNPGGFATGAMNHTGITSGCSTCHNGAAFQNVTPVSKGSNHVPTTLDCVTCHTSFVSFVGAAFSHSGITSGCASCHGGQAFQNVTPVTKGGTHLLTTLDCGTCHLSTTAFGPGTAMNHSGITSGCASCHTGQAFQGVTPVSQPATGHVPTSGQDCSTCHTSFTSFLGATYSHSGVAAGTCYSCHNGSYAGVMSIASGTPSGKTHVATASNSCDGCHTGAKTPGGFATATMGSAGHALTSPPTTTATVCWNCHYNGLPLGASQFPNHHHQTQSCISSGCHKTGFTSIP